MHTRSKQKTRYLLGIDEVGRGAIAGPVTVGFMLVNISDLENLKNLFPFEDSKKLSVKKRASFYQSIISEQKINAITQSMSANQIDKYGISRCLKECVSRGLEKLALDKVSTRIVADFGLCIPDNYLDVIIEPKADQNHWIVAGASIYAKVMRDDYMTKLAIDYPNYYLENNKGYGTKKHLDSIARVGHSEVHRISWKI